MGGRPDPVVLRASTGGNKTVVSRPVLGYDGDARYGSLTRNSILRRLEAVAISWGEFEQAQPGMAEAGRALLYQFGVGLAFLPRSAAMADRGCTRCAH